MTAPVTVLIATISTVAISAKLVGSALTSTLLLLALIFVAGSGITVIGVIPIHRDLHANVLLDLAKQALAQLVAE